MSYEAFIRDAREVSLTPSTRLRAAFDALYDCCLQRVDTEGLPVNSVEECVQAVVTRTLATLNLSADDGTLVRCLADWVLHVAPLEPLPMTPENAVALAEQLQKTIGE
ncbi:hypothetical protein VSR82_32795 [Burkholderia sp. JPY481]